MQAGWIETWGLGAVLVGAIFEGETVLIAAGYAVSQGLLPPLATLALAIAGGSLGDHAFYLVGRVAGVRIFRLVPGLRPLRARATLLLRRWGRSAAFSMRFAYGLRAVLPISMGAARFPVRLFLPFNLLGSVAFSVLYLTIGYFFGEAAEELLGRMRAREAAWILLGIVAAGAVVWAVREWKLFHSDDPAAGRGSTRDPAEPPTSGDPTD